MFALLTGRLVHEGRSTNEVLLHAMTKAAPPIASVAPNVTPAVARLVDKALSFEREKRWLDARRMQEAVRHAYVDRYGAPITTAPKLTVPPEETLTTSMPAATTAQPVSLSRVLQRVRGLSWAVIAAITAATTLTLMAVVALVASAGSGKGTARPAEATPINVATALPAAVAPPPSTVAPPATHSAALSTALIPTVEPSSLPAAAPASAASPPAPFTRFDEMPKPDECDPPYVIDANGHKTYKRNCLNTPPPEATATDLPRDPYSAPPKRPASSASAKPRHVGAASMGGE